MTHNLRSLLPACMLMLIALPVRAQTEALQNNPDRAEENNWQLAPDDGVISNRNATLGAVGVAGDELFRLIRQNRLEWHGELTAEQAARTVQGQSVILMLPHGEKVQGTIRQLAPTFASTTRMTTLFVAINHHSSACAGMYAQGQIFLGQQRALTVPAKSVVIRDGRSYLFRLHHAALGTTVSQHEVQVGQLQGDQAQILSGISAGDRIVLLGAGFLNEGDTVRVAGAQGGQE